jgi:copper chaperone
VSDIWYARSKTYYYPIEGEIVCLIGLLYFHNEKGAVFSINGTAKSKNMKTQELKIEGMSCGHCVMSVKKELSKLAGVVVEDVQIGKAKIQYDETKISTQMIADTIDGAGYKLVGMN